VGFRNRGHNDAGGRTSKRSGRCAAGGTAISIFSFGHRFGARIRSVRTQNGRPSLRNRFLIVSYRFFFFFYDRVTGTMSPRGASVGMRSQPVPRCRHRPDANDCVRAERKTERMVLRGSVRSEHRCVTTLTCSLRTPRPFASSSQPTIDRRFKCVLFRTRSEFSETCFYCETCFFFPGSDGEKKTPEK
jgi:hypothetical protein